VIALGALQKDYRHEGDHNEDVDDDQHGLHGGFPAGRMSRAKRPASLKMARS
jgi:hypothetical protein